MAWIYLAESEESQRPWNPGCGQSPIVRMTGTLKPCCCPEWEAEIFLWLPYGMTCEHCGVPVLGLSVLSLEASLARTSVLLAAVKAWQESEADFSLRSHGWLAKYDQDSSSWKTCQLYVPGVEPRLSELWPASGMTVDGTCYPLTMWGRRISENDGFCWRTPRATEWKDARPSLKSRENGKLYEGLSGAVKMWRTPRANKVGGYSSPGFSPTLESAVKTWPTPTARDYRTGDKPESRRARNVTQKHTPMLNDVAAPGGQLNADWVSLLMGYPIHWTVVDGNVVSREWLKGKKIEPRDSKPLETPLSQPKRGKRSKD